MEGNDMMLQGCRCTHGSKPEPQQGLWYVLGEARRYSYKRGNANIDIAHVLWVIHMAVNLGVGPLSVDEARDILTPSELPRSAAERIAQFADNSHYKYDWQVKYSDELQCVLDTLPNEADVRHLYRACYEVFVEGK